MGGGPNKRVAEAGREKEGGWIDEASKRAPAKADADSALTDTEEVKESNGQGHAHHSDHYGRVVWRWLPELRKGVVLAKPVDRVRVATAPGFGRVSAGDEPSLTSIGGLSGGKQTVGG